MKKILHFIYIPLTGLGIVEYKGDEWFAYRVELFKRFVLPSLKNQQDKDFILWISFRPQEKDNPVTKKLENYIKKAGLRYIFTFHGIAMKDDRGVWHNATLPQRMEKMLKEIQDQTEKAEWVYKTDLGSDDMFSEEAIKEIKEINPQEYEAGYFINGYALHFPTMTLAEWNRPTSCSKYTVIYPYDTFFNAEKHLYHIKDLTTHEIIPTIYKAFKLPDRRYMAGIHKGNISTHWNHPFKGRELKGQEKQEVLKKFGLSHLL